MALHHLPAASGAQKLFFVTVLRPMWRGQVDQLMAAQRAYRHYLIAINCLHLAVGPGGDPMQVVEFCRNWSVALTIPLVGPTALLRRLGKVAGAAPVAAAALDPTAAINTGMKVVARLGPLIGRIQMDHARQVALDGNVVSKSDQSAVFLILDSAKTPQALVDGIKKPLLDLQKTWAATVDMAQKLEAARVRVGMPESTG